MEPLISTQPQIFPHSGKKPSRISRRFLAWIRILPKIDEIDPDNFRRFLERVATILLALAIFTVFVCDLVRIVLRML